jgi:hypothetical protein
MELMGYYKIHHEKNESQTTERKLEMLIKIVLTYGVIAAVVASLLEIGSEYCKDETQKEKFVKIATGLSTSCFVLMIASIVSMLLYLIWAF